MLSKLTANSVKSNVLSLDVYVVFMNGDLFASSFYKLIKLAQGRSAQTIESVELVTLLASIIVKLTEICFGSHVHLSNILLIRSCLCNTSAH